MERWALVLGLVIACGDSTGSPTDTSTPSGGSAGAAGQGGSAAGGSAGSQAGGSAGSGGTSAAGSGGADAAGAGGASSGGAGSGGASVCGNGAPFPELPPGGKACAAPEDCTFYVRRGCCGDDYIGLAKKEAGAFVTKVDAWQATCPECGLVGCAAFDHAEDGTQSQSSPSKPKLLCEAGACKTSFGP